MVLLTIFAAFFITCKKEKKQRDVDAPNVHIDNPIIRLFYFEGGNYDGDPSGLPNPHLIKEAVSADGINFGDSKIIYQANDIMDPDVFKIDNGQYGLLATDNKNSSVVVATSSSPDGPFTTQGVLTAAISGLGQSSATIRYNGVLRTYSNGDGIALGSLNVSTRMLSADKKVINVSHVNMSSGIVGDPSVAKMADGRYIMAFKYVAGPNIGPDGQQVYTIISPDPTSFTGKATMIKDKGGVPAIVRVGSKLYVYFVNGSTVPTKISVGISSDNGGTWTFSDAKLNGLSFTSGVDPSALPVDETNLD